MKNLIRGQMFVQVIFVVVVLLLIHDITQSQHSACIRGQHNLADSINGIRIIATADSEAAVDTLNDLGTRKTRLSEAQQLDSLITDWETRFDPHYLILLHVSLDRSRALHSTFSCH